MSDQPSLWDAAVKEGFERVIRHAVDHEARKMESELLYGRPVAPETQRLIEAGRAHARRTDPYTSDKALKAIANDGTLMSNIWLFVSLTRPGPFNDTELTDWLENITNERQQRNVVARARGLLEQAGFVRRVGVLEYQGRELMHYEIDPNNPKENPNG